MKWTEAQRAAIELRNKNILVSAAAGSGKTAVLVERMKRLILEEGVSLNEMLMVTFSNAAAGEMKAKIITAIDKEMETNQRDMDFLRKQTELIYKANISTFHAFAMEVIRRYFQLIGIQPDFKICDEAQKTILQAEAMEQLFSELFQAKDEEFFLFLQHYSGSKNENPVKEMIYQVHRFIQSVPKPFAWLRQQVEQLQQSGQELLNGKLGTELMWCIHEDLEMTAAYLRQVQEMLEMAGLENLSRKSSLDLAGVEEFQQVMKDQGLEAVLTAMSRFSFQRFVAAKDEKEPYGEIKDEVSAVRDKGKAVLKKLLEQFDGQPLQQSMEQLSCTHPQAQCLERMVQRFDSIYREKKEKKGVIDFNDIEHYALDILEHEEAAGEYRKKFRYIFIDEYQDSNIVQETLISRICREDNVFMVGDVKQSIYKFRLAEPELFMAKYEKYKKEDNPQECKVDLNSNFRSKSAIIGGINHVFQQIMNQRTTGMEYDDNAALHGGLINEEIYNYPLSLHLVDDSLSEEEDLDEEIAEMKKIEVEACTAAQLLKQAYGKTVFDSKKGCERQITYGDMVVLLRSAKSTGQLYFQALTDAGIPCFADSSDGYFDTVEIQVFLNLLRVIDNGSQDLPLLSVMRSAIFAFDLEEMTVIRIGARRMPYYKSLTIYEKRGQDPALREKVHAMLESLRLWQSQAAYMTLEDFLLKLLRETGYETFVSAIPGGSQRKANLKALVDKAVQYQSSQMKGLFGFIRYVEAMQKQKISTGEVRLVGENDDVVRIMTIHKSKGLEFPLVLLGGLGKKLGGGRDLASISLNRDLGLALRLVDPKLGIYSKTMLQWLIERRKKREDMAEEIRILYVAFTRAMDELILLGSVDSLEKASQAAALPVVDVAGAKSYLELILPALEGSDIQQVSHSRGEISGIRRTERWERDSLRLALSQGFSDAAHCSEMEASWKERLSVRFLYRYPFEERTQVRSKYTVSELVQKAKQSRAAAESWAGGNFSASGIHDDTGNRGAGKETADTGASRKPEAEQRLKYDVSSLMPKFLTEGHAFTGAERGTILHSIMEFIPFHEWKDKRSSEELTEAVQALTEGMISRELLTEEQASAVDLSLIVGFLTSDMGRRVCAAEELHKESPFNLRMEVDGEEALVQGIVDCYFREGDHYVLLDYKSNSTWMAGKVSAEQRIEQEASFERELAEMYEPQLALYRAALERIRGIEVKESYLYSFALGREVRIG